MRPALQRLLARPSSLDLLRCLIRPDKHVNQTAWKGSRTPAVGRCRSYLAAETPVLAVKDSKSHFLGDIHVEADLLPTMDPTPPESRANISGPAVLPEETPGPSTPNPIPRVWEEEMFTLEDLEKESNFEALDHVEIRRLVDNPELAENMGLWRLLLDFRRRRYGEDGTTSIWRAIRARELRIPVVGKLASDFWMPFLQLGFKNDDILLEICQYADEMYDSAGLRWNMLYVYVMQNFLLQGRGGEVEIWHNRLIHRHAPSPLVFQRFMRNMVFVGAVEPLKALYLSSQHRNVYGKVVGALVERKDFTAALSWHYFLLRHGDKPSNPKSVAPLIQHFANHHRKTAKQLTKSLISSGALFAPVLTDDLSKTALISSEMMNLIHGKFHNIAVKRYNDNLGARWFATKWVGLDLAISAVHALGVQAIGPLSLQSIALREADPDGVLNRIWQLQGLGISIEDSVFSKAVAWFAAKSQPEFLRGLLESDQHPDALEDGQLQESLMASYARAGDWGKYRVIEAVQLVGLRDPEVEKHNLVLRRHLSTVDHPEIVRTLERMRMSGIAVTPKTLRYMLSQILPPRRPGMPPATISDGKDLDTAVAILEGVMLQGFFVPVSAWKEIIRRLGMTGRLDALDQLCIWLAQWYNPDSDLRSKTIVDLSSHKTHRDLDLPPPTIPTLPPFHPLSILFPPSLQKAIVEWGFVHSLQQPPEQLPKWIISDVQRDAAVAKACTRGLRLLLQLKQHGVGMEVASIRRALYTRLVILYGPEISYRIYNRRSRLLNPLKLEQMVVGIKTLWDDILLHDIVDLERKISTALGQRRQRAKPPASNLFRRTYSRRDP